MSYKLQKRFLLLGFLFIPLLMLLAFTYYPAVRLVQYSFTDWDGLAKNMNFVGFDNYKRIFTDSEILAVFSHNIAYLIVAVFQNIAGVFLAVVLNKLGRGSKIYRSTIFMPYVMNSVAVAYIFAFMYDYNNGAFNHVIRFLGGEGIRFLSDPFLVNFSLAMIGFWKFTGFAMVIYLGALQAVDNDLYEAASIDGAGPWNQFKAITLPAIRRIIELQLFLAISGSMKAFDEAFAITKGGPNGASETFVMKTMASAFNFSNFGLASAMGIVLMIIILIVTSFKNKLPGEE